MLEFLKNLVRPAEPARLQIRSADIPGWLAGRRGAYLQALDAETEKERREIRSAVDRFRKVIQVLAAARFSEEIHPRLKSIAEKSLPQYTKAVNSILEKPLPEEPAEFYAAAAELLKSCINSARGQGKYLQAAFPDEMKAITACIAAIGRNINAMNGPVGTYRKGIALVDEAARIHGALADIDADCHKSREKEERMQQRIGELSGRIAACDRASRELERERAGHDLVRKEQEMLRLKHECGEALQQYSALSMTASHVLRKAEKIARRRQKPGDEKAVARAMAILSDHGVPESPGLAGVLSAAYGPARRMIDEEEISLKNREERELFSSEQEFVGRIMAPCTRHAAVHAGFVAAGQAFASDPVITRLAEVRKEAGFNEEMLAKERQAHADLREWQQELSAKIPAMREQLRKIIGEIAGGDVQVSFPG